MKPQEVTRHIDLSTYLRPPFVLITSHCQTDFPFAVRQEVIHLADLSKTHGSGQTFKDPRVKGDLC